MEPGSPNQYILGGWFQLDAQPERQERKLNSLTRAGRHLILLALATLTGVPSAYPAPASRPGLLVMAHGGSKEWNSAVEEAVAPLADNLPVDIAFGMAQAGPLQSALERLESKGVTHIAVVRLFISQESFREQTEYLLGLRSDPPSIFLVHDMTPGLSMEEAVRILPGTSAPSAVNRRAALVMNQEGLYDSDRTGRILVDRVKGLSLSPRNESVLIIAHGEGDRTLNEEWISRLRELSAQISGFAPFREVRVETLREDWPEERREAEGRIQSFVESENRKGGEVLVVPFRVFGFGPYDQVLDGIRYKSDGKALLPHPEITEWIKDQAEDCFARMKLSPVFSGSSPGDEFSLKGPSDALEAAR